ncbi:glucose-1-phosphate adenylyltransferase [Nocardioides sp. Y6]|uniref:Glucose-1-phosphate adenylyltransferase n=1 Tax=Nocardioides malaquae TaxID=2773426 RepID=A0ABR9RVW2_9ACTN|nr:sugar phosphate nucleotidyltransferase [Nocardioides malaquae]MBE7325735.1 glucose-1-phosphate adenylyltransferase [Nocardioides malaquae]
MRLPRILGLVQAGGAGGRMDVLTLEHAKPALPYAGDHQLVDVSLSTLATSGVQDVWLSVQYQAGSLEEQVRNGRPWDLDRSVGGFRLVPPEQGSGSLHEEGMNAGNADELYGLRDQLRDSGADLVVVMSADHVYRLDLRDVVETHLAKEAEVTVVSTDLGDTFAEDPADHAVVQVNRLGRVTDVAYKPERPVGSLVAAEIFVYEVPVLVEVLEELHRELAGEEDDSGLGDFGEHLLPRMVQRGKAFAHHLDGYWRDLGQPHHYLNAHLELIDHGLELFDGTWPLHTSHRPHPPARVGSGARVEDSLLSPGSRVAGTVRRSVLGPDVVVEEGAVVEESVLFGEVVVRSGARVRRSVVDTGCELLDGADVGAADIDLTDPDAIVLVGRDSRVASALPPGARLAPGTTA